MRKLTSRAVLVTCLVALVSVLVTALVAAPLALRETNRATREGLAQQAELAAALINTRPRPAGEDRIVQQLRTRGFTVFLVADGKLVSKGTVPPRLVKAVAAGLTVSNQTALVNGTVLSYAVIHLPNGQVMMTFVDVTDSVHVERALKDRNEALEKSPNSISALYSLALLLKYRRQYQASMRSLQRCLELNPSFLPAQGQIANVLTRMGQPQNGLEQILQTIRVATANDPTMGYWYLFAAEAELELGHERAALDWALRANAFMPGSPLVQAWLASIYATLGDRTNAAKSVAALTKMAPGRTRLFMNRPSEDTNSVSGRHGPRIFDGLRLALRT